MVTYSDEELMMQFQAGNAYGFELLCGRYRGPVFAFLFRMLGGDRGAAEDLLQDIFVKVSGAACLYEPRAKFSTWLFTIARNHCRNYLKSREYLKSRLTVPMDGDAFGPEAGSGTPANRLADRTDTLREVQTREDAGILEAAIGRLPERYREVFILRAVHGIRHEEAARILDMNPATVRTNYRRACERLRTEVAPALGVGSRAAGGGNAA
jgi:RNA polymerase sigma-70 factor (ECF subfamily)